ncbi:hypothetical protein HDA40_000899 [Hamadaea flava]|uniref:Lipoprotein n=1 Tax=Hamadaea flava TaxID=1742688 RepID=A0ABV8LPT6_9ACTN|nr:hypothetical protein [Hamadaea flava]MCP2322392.1 hypothetical protein [Hamadaea flava]
MIGRRLRNATGVAALLLLLGGCTPWNSVFAAVSNQGGGTTLMQICAGGGSATSISLADADDSATAWRVSGPGLEEDSAPFFQTPDGWAAGDGILTSIAAGHRYRLEVGISNSSVAPNSTFDFAADDLASLEAGKVMAADGKGGYTIMTEQEFRDRADGAC